MGQLSVKIDDDLEERIDQEIDKFPYEIKKSDVVRTALDEYLDELDEGNGNKTSAATA